MIFKKITILFLFSITFAAFGQEENTEKELTFDVGADLVSSYIWRGKYVAGPSIQPTMSISAYGLTIGAWGSKDFITTEKEIDFLFSYKFKGFSIGFADYWVVYEEDSFFKNKSSHLIEGSLGYTFPEKFPLSLEINTFLSGDEDLRESGRKYYSTYISASFPFTVGEVDVEAGIGVSPWNGMYSKEFNVATVSTKVSKTLKLTGEYSMSVFTELIVAPVQNNIFLVFGITF